jgi:hypothetical protein
VGAVHALHRGLRARQRHLHRHRSRLQRPANHARAARAHRQEDHGLHGPSLGITSGGILLCYLLFKVAPAEGKTLNGVLVEAFAGNWTLFGLPVGKVFVGLVLASEGALLFVAAQTGFIDGPRVMSNMAVDSWLPRRFASLSDRLTTANGIIILGSAALILLVATHGNIDTLVVMYAINVFVTFSLSQAWDVPLLVAAQKTRRSLEAAVLCFTWSRWFFASPS